jgi:hypothetical protein
LLRGGREKLEEENCEREAENKSLIHSSTWAEDELIQWSEQNDLARKFVLFCVFTVA